MVQVDYDNLENYKSLLPHNLQENLQKAGTGP